MALEEYTVDKNTGYIPQATKDTPEGVLQDIERRALAQQTVAKISDSKAEAAGQAASGSTEGKVYGDMAADAMGFRAISTLVGVVGARLSDRNNTDGVQEHMAAPSRHIDEDVRSAGRAPGVYRNPAEAHAFGAVPNVKGGNDLSSLSIGERVGLTGSALKAEQGTGNLKTWEQKSFESARVGSVHSQIHAMELQNEAKLGKEATYTSQIANEQALSSVKVAREHQSVMKREMEQAPRIQAPAFGMGGMGMGPGGMNLDLSSGPRFNHSQFLSGTDDKTGAA